MKEFEFAKDLVNDIKEHFCKEGKDIANYDIPTERKFGFVCNGCGESWETRLRTHTLNMANKETIKLFGTSEGRKQLAKNLSKKKEI
jgi:hypothetical protein